MTDALIAALETRNRAVRKNDVAYLDSILVPEYRHIHTTGKVDLRDVYLASVRKGDRVFPVLNVSELKVDVYGDAGMIRGDIYMERAGRPGGKNSRFVSVWKLENERWMLAHWQVTAREDMA